MTPRPNDTTAPTREPIARYLLRRSDLAQPVVDDLPLPDYQRARPTADGENVYERVRR